jgi:hypothetical protein
MKPFHGQTARRVHPLPQPRSAWENSAKDTIRLGRLDASVFSARCYAWLGWEAARTAAGGPEPKLEKHSNGSRKERILAIPEYLICLNCESPTYVFEWKNDEVVEAYCEVCTSEETDQFLTQEEFDTLVEGG